MAARPLVPFLLYGITSGAYVGALLWVSSRAPDLLLSALGALIPQVSRSSFVSFYAVAGACCLILLPVLSFHPHLWLRGRRRQQGSASATPDQVGPQERLRRDLLVLGSLTALLLLCTMLGSVQTTLRGSIPAWFLISAPGLVAVICAYAVLARSALRRPRPPTA